MEFCYIPAGEAQLGSLKAEQDYITKTYFDGNRPAYLDYETEAAGEVRRWQVFPTHVGGEPIGPIDRAILAHRIVCDNSMSLQARRDGNA